MSSPELWLDLSPAAQEDLVEIIHYTALEWGASQARLYHEAIASAFELLRRHPDIGHKSLDLPDCYQLYPVGSHVIVFYLEADTICVARVLHQRMSLRGNIHR